MSIHSSSIQSNPNTEKTLNSKILRVLVFAPIFSVVSLAACAGSNYSYSSDSKSNDKSGEYSATKTSTKMIDIVIKSDTSMGQVFANGQGMTLYTFSRDSKNTPSCYGGCAASWPPFYAKKRAKEWGQFTVVTRNDGSFQWAFDGSPLYLWVGDKQQGDVTGHGINNVWYVASVK